MKAAYKLTLCLGAWEGVLGVGRKVGGFRGAWSPQLIGDPVSADLLGASLLLCLEGNQVTRKSTAGLGQG